MSSFTCRDFMINTRIAADRTSYYCTKACQIQEYQDVFITKPSLIFVNRHRSLQCGKESNVVPQLRKGFAKIRWGKKSKEDKEWGKVKFA